MTESVSKLWRSTLGWPNWRQVLEYCLVHQPNPDFYDICLLMLSY